MNERPPQITVPENESMPADLRAALEKWAATMNEFGRFIADLQDRVRALERSARSAGPQSGSRWVT